MLLEAVWARSAKVHKVLTPFSTMDDMKQNALSPTAPPRYWQPFGLIVMPVDQNRRCASSLCSGFVSKIVFKALGEYPQPMPILINSFQYLSNVSVCLPALCGRWVSVSKLLDQRVDSYSIDCYCHCTTLASPFLRYDFTTLRNKQTEELATSAGKKTDLRPDKGEECCSWLLADSRSWTHCQH